MGKFIGTEIELLRLSMVQMEVDHYNEMIILRKKLSDLELKNIGLLTEIKELEVYKWKYEGLCK